MHACMFFNCSSCNYVISRLNSFQSGHSKRYGALSGVGKISCDSP